VFHDPELHKDVDWSTVDEYQNNLASTGSLSNEELKREQKRLTLKYKNKTVFRQTSDWDKKGSGSKS
jgi:hypothetical protein